MPPRPAGTDGSDHEFRERVAQEYKTMPLWRTAAWLLLHFTAVPLAMSVAWSFVPYYIAGELPRLNIAAIVILYVCAVSTWSAARPATAMESLSLTKITNIFLVFVMTLQVMHLFKYHIMDIKQHLYPRRLWKFLSEERGYAGDFWLPLFTGLEALMDGGLMVCAMFTSYCFHTYIHMRMELDAKLKGATAGSKPALPAPRQAAPKDTPQLSGPRRRRA